MKSRFVTPTAALSSRMKRTSSRETLLELQDALQQAARLTGKAMHFDHIQAREGSYTQLPSALSDEMHTNVVEVRRLTARVLDSPVRAAVDDFIGLSTRMSMLSTDLKGLVGEALESHSAAKLKQFGDGYTTLSEIVSEARRREIRWQPGKQSHVENH